MHLERAIADLDVLRTQVLRSEHYRGYRARTSVAAAVLAALAVPAQGVVVPGATSLEFVLYWSGVACVAAAAAAIDAWRAARAELETPHRTWTVASQLLPALGLGALSPCVLLPCGDAGAALIPGFWAGAFGLAVFASRPFLPRGVGWVGLYFVCAGVVLAAAAPAGTPEGWRVGGVFAVGMAGAAGVLGFGRERRDACEA